MDETPDQPVDDAPASGEASRPFAPRPTLALDHVPPINVEVGSGAHGGPAPPRVARQPGPLEAGGLRIVIVAWCFWLLGSWAMSWVAETSSVLRMFQYGASVPVVRWMLLSGMLGMMVVWPAFRLGQPVHPREPGRGALQAFLDWLAMVLVFQAVVWSLQVIAGWTLARGLWLDAAVVSWTLLTALIVGWGRTAASGLVRTFAMALCLAVVLAEPVLGWLRGTDLGTGAMRWSPLETVWVLTNLPERASVSPWSERIIVVGMSAVLGWGVLAVWGWVTRPKRPIARTLEDDPYGQLVAVVDIAAGQREPGASARMDRPSDPRNGDQDDTNPRAISGRGPRGVGRFCRLVFCNPIAPPTGEGVRDMEFITSEEKATLQAKLQGLRDNRPKIIERIAEARALGDLKENAEYHAAREEQGMQEMEIKRLEERIATAQIADDVEKPDDMVFLGTVVKLRDTDDDSEDLYKLVGEASGNFDADEIEVTASSPLGAALMKSRVGETVKADLPRGVKRFVVLEIM